jgi:hypothetical protein
MGALITVLLRIQASVGRCATLLERIARLGEKLEAQREREWTRVTRDAFDRDPFR